MGSRRIVIETKAQLLAEMDKIEGEIIIYGAGWAGTLILQFLTEKGIKVNAFAVTHKGEEYVGGLPVYSLDELLLEKDRHEFNLIMAVGEFYRAEMEEELAERGIFPYFEASGALQCEIYEDSMERKARKALAAPKREDKSRITIGVLSREYPQISYAEERLIVNKIERADYTVIPWEPLRIEYRGNQLEKDLQAYRHAMNACYRPHILHPDVDVIYTMNGVCDVDIPWIASFETTIPRMWPSSGVETKHYLRLIECMKRPNCKALYAFCQSAYNIQKHTLMERVSVEDMELLMKKTKVLHPPQKVLITEEEFEKKHTARELHFIFVGRDFFVKGGKEVLHALSKFEGKYQFKLTLVSSLGNKNPFCRIPSDEEAACRKMIREKTWIEYYPCLRNEEVLEKCKTATVGLMPSVADTYGYVILEMQAAGCPVITTNVRAQSEINNEECGWLCKLPVNGLGISIYRDNDAWSGILEEELGRCLQDIFEHPDLVREKGKKALKRIQEMHDPYRYQNELRKCF